ncbi:MAG: tripartite tricarboxylate transporter substrate-binding protein, partial [Burkholderiales bacterium]
KVRLLAVHGKARSALFPGTPTMAEAGTKLDISLQFAMYAPAGTPNEIVTRRNREIARAMQSPKARALLVSFAA